MSKEWDSNGRFYYFAPLEDIYSLSNNAGDINRSQSNFNGDISSLIQKMVNKDKSEIQSEWKKYAMWFSTANESTTSSYLTGSSSTNYSADASSYYVGKLNGPLHTNYPTIEIVYAIMND